MDYQVLPVADDALPKGVHRVIVEQDEGPPLLLINGETARCWSFMRTFEDACEPATVPTVAMPALRAV